MPMIMNAMLSHFVKNRNAISAHQYSVDDIDLEHVQHIKNLCITFDVKLNFSTHISEHFERANSILGIVRRNFKYLPQENFVTLYKALVRSHMARVRVVTHITALL